MRRDIRRRYDAHLRVFNLCAEHRARFDADAGGRKLRTSHGVHLANIARLLILQKRSIEDARAAAELTKQSRRALHDSAGAIVKFGRIVDVQRATPTRGTAPATTTMGALKLPRPMSDTALVAYMRALLEFVSPYADAFVAEGLPPDRLDIFARQIQSFAATRETQAVIRLGFTAATESIMESLDAADTIVDGLEALAIIMPGNSSELLTSVRMARRVGPRLSRKVRVLQATLRNPLQALLDALPFDRKKLGAVVPHGLLRGQPG